MPRSRKSRFQNKTVPNIIVVSDTHCGCSMGLQPVDGKTQNGTPIKQSRLQRKLWEWWEELWGEWVPRVTRGEPFAVVANGDLIDGVHHNSTTQWSHNLVDHRWAAIEIFKPVVDLCEGRFYMVRGTEAHVGKSAEHEIEIAKQLNAIKDEDGHGARWELSLRCGGSLCHFTHHIGTTSSASHEASAINAEIAAILTDCGRFGREPPLVVVRSHRHRNYEVRGMAKHGYMSSFVTAAWQLKTPFAYRTASRNLTPQIGASLIRAGDEEVYTRHYVKDVDPPKEELL